MCVCARVCMCVCGYNIAKMKKEIQRFTFIHFECDVWSLVTL